MFTRKIVGALIIGALLSTSVSADIKAGQKTYLKLLKNKFNMSGTKFAAEHTVAEWESLFADGAAGFIKEYSEKYPSSKSVLENPSNLDKLKDVGDFAREYGNDSGNVPSCG